MVDRPQSSGCGPGSGRRGTVVEEVAFGPDERVLGVQPGGEGEVAACGVTRRPTSNGPRTLRANPCRSANESR